MIKKEREREFIYGYRPLCDLHVNIAWNLVMLG